MAHKLTPGASQGSVQSSNDTQFAPVEAGKPVTGFDEAPATPLAEFGPGAGIGGTGRGIH